MNRLRALLARWLAPRPTAMEAQEEAYNDVVVEWLSQFRARICREAQETLDDA